MVWGPDLYLFLSQARSVHPPSMFKEAVITAVVVDVFTRTNVENIKMFWRQASVQHDHNHQNVLQTI